MVEVKTSGSAAYPTYHCPLCGRKCGGYQSFRCHMSAKHKEYVPKSVIVRKDMICKCGCTSLTDSKTGKVVCTNPACHHQEHQRPSWDELWIGLVDKLGERATCDRGRSGCVIVRDNTPIMGSYVGSLPGQPHCDEVGHQMFEIRRIPIKILDNGVQSHDYNNSTEGRHCCRTLHAEANALAQCAKFGIATDKCTLYCKLTPCYDCAKIIVMAGIKRVVAKHPYHPGVPNPTIDMFNQCGVDLVILNSEEAY